MILKNNKKVLTLTAGCIASLTLAGSALGQDLTSGGSVLEAKEDPTSVDVFSVKPTYTHLFEADGDNGYGNVTVDRVETRAGYVIKKDDAQFGVGGLYEYSHYKFGGAGNSDFDMNRVGLNTHYIGMANENWGYFGYLGGEMAASKEATLSDGMMGTVAAGARYVWSPTLSLGFGLAYASGIEADARILPVIILNWQINEHWALRTLNGVTVTYDIHGDKQTVLDAGVNYQYREYATQGNNSSVVEKMVALELGVTHRFCKEFSMRGFVGMVAGREYEFYNNGNKGATPNVDNGAMAGISATLAF